MLITLNKLKALNPCAGGYAWFESQYKVKGVSLIRTLLDVDAYRPEWARWLFTRLMTRKQNIEMSIFCAKQVLSIFEDKYPDDKRPRKAIEAAERVLKHDTEENRQAAYAANANAANAADAAYAAYSAADAAYSAAYSAANAASAAYAAADAAYAAADAAYAAYSAADAYSAFDEKKLRQKIIRKAVKILERKE